MKKIDIKALFILAAGCILTACSEDDPWTPPVGDGSVPPGTDIGTGNSGTGIATDDGLEDFSIEFDTTPLSESETIPTDETDESYEDYLENFEVKRTVTIVYADDNVSITNNNSDVIAYADGTDVIVISNAKKVEYIVSGKCDDGSLKIYGENKFKLTLNGLELTHPDGAAINIQAKKRCYFVCNDGTTNVLTDGDNYVMSANEDMKGCIFSEGKIIFSGTGTLQVNGNYKHGICSDDYVRFRPGCNVSVHAANGNGVKTNDGIFVNGGVLNIAVTGDGKKGLSSDSHLEINGGRTTIIATGNAVYDTEENDVSGCIAIKCDSAFVMNGGTILLKNTGVGGKALKGSESVTFNGGNIHVITSGKKYVYSSTQTSSPKGIRSSGDLIVNGGNFKIRTSGGEGSEGMESKASMTICGGCIEISSYDDCINVANTKGTLDIQGGKIYCYASGNDAIDSNGTLYIQGGTTVAIGTHTPEGGIDCDNNKFAVTGGTLIATGGSNSAPTTSLCTQCCVSHNVASLSGKILCVQDASGHDALVYAMPDLSTGNSGAVMLFSTPSLTQSATYSILSGGTVNGDTEWHGYYDNTVYNGGTVANTFTTNSMVTNLSGSNSGRP